MPLEKRLFLGLVGLVFKSRLKSIVSTVKPEDVHEELLLWSLVAGPYVPTDEHRVQVNSFEGQVWLAHISLSKKEILANKLQIGFQALSCGMLLTLLHLHILRSSALQMCSCACVVFDTVDL